MRVCYGKHTSVGYVFCYISADNFCADRLAYKVKNLSSIVTPELISAERAEEWLAIAAHGDKFCCPTCGVVVSAKNYFAGLAVRCKQCRRKFTWRTGTIFEGMKLSAADVIILFDRMRLGMTDGEIAESTDINIETVKIWRYKYGILFNQCNQ